MSPTLITSQGRRFDVALDRVDALHGRGGKFLPQNVRCVTKLALQALPSKETQGRKGFAAAKGPRIAADSLGGSGMLTPPAKEPWRQL